MNKNRNNEYCFAFLAGLGVFSILFGIIASCINYVAVMG